MLGPELGRSVRPAALPNCGRWFTSIDWDPTDSWNTAIILLPLLPALGILRFALRQFRKGDEMQRRNQMEAVVRAFGASLVLMTGYTLLEVIGWPRLPMWVPLVVVQTVWIAATWTQLLRFR